MKEGFRLPVRPPAVTLRLKEPVIGAIHEINMWGNLLYSETSNPEPSRIHWAKNLEFCWFGI